MTIKSGAIRTVLTLMLLPSAHTVVAGELSTVINGKSYHIGSDQDWNEENYGLGLEYQFDTESRWKSLLMANGFRDSEKNMSYMAGGGLHRNLYSSERGGGLYLDLGLNVFLMTREDVNDGRPFPGALPSMTVGNRHVGINLTYLPRMAVEEVTTARTMDKDMRGILFLQFKVNVTEAMGLD